MTKEYIIFRLRRHTRLFSRRTIVQADQPEVVPPPRASLDRSSDRPIRLKKMSHRTMTPMMHGHSSTMEDSNREHWHKKNSAQLQEPRSVTVPYLVDVLVIHESKSWCTRISKQSVPIISLGLSSNQCNALYQKALRVKLASCQPACKSIASDGVQIPSPEINSSPFRLVCNQLASSYTGTIDFELRITP